MLHATLQILNRNSERTSDISCLVSADHANKHLIANIIPGSWLIRHFLLLRICKAEGELTFYQACVVKSSISLQYENLQNILCPIFLVPVPSPAALLSSVCPS